MLSNPTLERTALEATYEDTCTVLRPGKDTVGNITVAKPDVPVYTDVPCALSKEGNTSGNANNHGEINHTKVLFAAPELEIRMGDCVRVTRFGRMVDYKVLGRPDVYATHQEVKLMERDLA